jgi:hypothetical protein
MKKLSTWGGILCLIPLLAAAQDRISVTGSPIPQQLLVQNYGSMPKGVSGYDLSICNISEQKQTVVSSEIYQALAKSNVALTPIGRQIMLASILRNQSKSLSTILSVALTSATGVVALLGTSRSVNIPAGLSTTLGLSPLILGQLSTSLKPVLTLDKVEKFDRDVLQTALVLDTGSCEERTVFAVVPNATAKPSSLQFRVK